MIGVDGSRESGRRDDDDDDLYESEAQFGCTGYFCADQHYEPQVTSRCLARLILFDCYSKDVLFILTDKDSLI